MQNKGHKTNNVEDLIHTSSRLQVLLDVVKEMFLVVCLVFSLDYIYENHLGIPASQSDSAGHVQSSK